MQAAEAAMRRIGTSTCIIKGDEILVGKRGPDCRRGNGCYALPGGKLEQGESIIASAAREVLEETGLVVAYISRPFEIAPCFTVTDHFPDQEKLTLWLFANYQSGTPVNTEPRKCLGWEWRSLDWLYRNTPKSAVPEEEDYHWLPLPLLRHHLTPIITAPSVGAYGDGLRHGGASERRLPSM